MKRFRLRPLRELADILFPRHCIHCGELLLGDEQHLCTHCWMHLSYTHNAAVIDNDIEQHFLTHHEVVAAMSLLHFRTDCATRDIVHHIKYKGARRLGIIMGRLMGEEIAACGRFDGVGLILPVPLHRIREQQRGYNQSELLCRGIATRWPRPVITGNLIRTVNTESQTHMTFTERSENVKGVFDVRDPDRLKGQHILLVDDVVTTGSTTAACCDALIKAGVAHVSIASLALANASSDTW